MIHAHFVLTPNGELIRFPNIAMAKAMFLDQSVVYTSPQNMIDRLSLDDMNYLYRRVARDHITPYRSKEVAAEQLFPLLCERASPHNPRAQARARKEGVLIPEHPKDRAEKVPISDMRIFFASPQMFDKLSTKIPPQAYVLGRFLATRIPEGGYTFDTVRMDVRIAHDMNVLKTRQPPERIFKYYMDALADNGLMSFADKQGRPCDRPRNQKKDRTSVVVRHPLSKVKGSLT